MLRPLGDEGPLANPELRLASTEASERDQGDERDARSDVAWATDLQRIRDYLLAKTPTKESKSVQYDEAGGFQKSNQDFDQLAGSLPVKDYGKGIRSVEFSDGTTMSVRPHSSGGTSTLQINTPGERAIKVRYK
jgi:hypothetical protein